MAESMGVAIVPFDGRLVDQRDRRVAGCGIGYHGSLQGFLHAIFECLCEEGHAFLDSLVDFRDS